MLPRAEVYAPLDESSASTIGRVETKYAVGIAAAAFLRGEIADRVPAFEFIPGRPVTYITTVYYDTRTNDLYEQAERSYDDNTKLRVKEYWYLSRTNGAEVCEVSDVCYVEIKQRVRGRVVKKRLGVPKTRLKALFRGEDIWEDVVRPPGREAEARSRAFYDELRGWIGSHEFEPSSVISYRRRVYQTADASLRITFDDEIAVYNPPRGLYESYGSLTRDVLGRPIYRGKNVILEVKSPSEVPGWLGEAFRNHASRRLSKFTTSVRALRSELDAPRNDGSHERNGQKSEKSESGTEDTQRIAETFQ